MRPIAWYWDRLQASPGCDCSTCALTRGVYTLGHLHLYMRIYRPATMPNYRPAGMP